MDKIVDQLLADHASRMYSNRRYIRDLGVGRWTASFGVVQVSLGRAAGHTTYIKQRAQPCDLVLTAHARHCEEFRGHPAVCMGMGSFRSHHIGRRTVYQTVWIDASAVQSSPTLSHLVAEVIEYHAHQNFTPFIIVLGAPAC